MRNFFKYVTFALAMIAGISVAHAANPLVVKGYNSSGTAVAFGMDQPYLIKKDLSNTWVVVRSALGEQIMRDDAGWNQYNKLVAACGSKCMAVPGSPIGEVINVTNSITYCQPQGYSQIVFPTWTETLSGDGCAFANSVN